MNIIRSSENLIELIINQTSKALARTQDLERIAIEILTGKGIDRDYYETIY